MSKLPILRRGAPAAGARAWRAHLARALIVLAAGLLAAAAAAQAQAPGGQAPAAASSQPSEAEQLMFLHDHLANSRQLRTLRYRYVADAQGQARVTDRAVLTLGKDAAGHCCDVHGDYLSGPLAVNLPDIPDARSNPVLLYFLESEVRLLQQTTRGQAAHFRRRIRQALADTATVSASTVQWDGRTLPARTVRVAPFLDDPFRARFEQQAATEYAFVLADGVPGGVYEMSASLPGQPGAAPLARRSLTIEDAQ